MGWDWLKRLIRRDDEEMFLEWMNSTPAPTTDVGHTVQIRLADMHLGRSRDFGRDRIPVLQSAVSTPQGIDVPMTISPKAFEALGDNKWKWVQQRHLPLTGQFPFDVRSGEIKLVVGLLYVTGGGVLTEAASFLNTLSGLVQVPYLSSASDIAEKVAVGAESLVGAADPKGRLAFEMGVPWQDLRSGYLLAAAADENEVDRERISVDADGHLSYSGGDITLRPIDYVLLRVDILPDSGESWQKIPTIWDPFSKALSLLGDAAKLTESRAYLLSAMGAARTSVDLTVGERSRVRDLLKTRWQAEYDALPPEGRTDTLSRSLDELLAADDNLS